jgi:hypothetical protein
MRKKSVAKAAPAVREPLEWNVEAAIAERAYAIWEAEGRPAGAAVRNWLQAEEEIWRERGRGPVGTSS